MTVHLNSIERTRNNTTTIILTLPLRTPQFSFEKAASANEKTAISRY